MTNKTNLELTALYNYLMEIKPYHTKIRDMVVKYTYTDSFNVVVTDELHNIFTHLTSHHRDGYKTSIDFGSISEAPGKFSGISDGSVAYKKWQIPDPHMGLSSLLFDHKQPLIVTSTGAVTSTDYVAPLRVKTTFDSFSITSITRNKTIEVDAYASTYALDIVGKLVYKTTTNIASKSNFSLYFKMNKLTSGSDYTVTTFNDVEGNYLYTTITINVVRTIYLDYKKYKDTFSSIYIDGLPTSKPNIYVDSDIVKTIVNNVVMSDKSFYFPLLSDYNPFSYTNYAVKSTPTHQIGVIDEIPIAQELDITKTIDITNVTITVDTIGHTTIVNEGYDNTLYDQYEFDNNLLQSVTAYDPSVLNVTVIASYTMTQPLQSNRRVYCDGALVLSTDKYGNLTTHDARFNVEGKKIYFNGICNITVSEDNFTVDELLAYYDADTRTVTNGDAIIAVVLQRILTPKYVLDIYHTSSGAYKVPYYDYVNVYVNGVLKDSSGYIENSPYKDMIVFKTPPSLYDQITFDMFNFGKIFVTIDDIPIPLYYDPSEMFTIDNFYDIDLTEKNETSEDIVVKSVNVYTRPFTIVRNSSGVITDIVVDETAEKTLYGYIRRVLNTSSYFYYMFEFAETPAAGQTVEIDVLQCETFNTLANTVMDEELYFTIHAREKDSCFTNIVDHLYVDRVLYATYNDEIVESNYQINKLIMEHSFDSNLNKKRLYVYTSNGQITTDYAAVYEDKKLKLTFTRLDKFKVEIK